MLCRKCKKEKSIHRFELRNDTEKLRNICKDCRNERSRKKYIQIKEKISKRRKELYHANAEEKRKYQREDWWKNREKYLRLRRERQTLKPKKKLKWKDVKHLTSKEKRSCYDKIRRSLKNGEIVKPLNCIICGQICTLHAHHHDYKKPLDVVWVCSGCHSLIHSKHFKEDMRQ